MSRGVAFAFCAFVLIGTASALLYLQRPARPGLDAASAGEQTAALCLEDMQGYALMADASKEQGVRGSIMGDLEERSGTLCARDPLGCVYSLELRDDEWFVHIEPHPRLPDGDCLHVPGAGRSYYYSEEGHYLREFPDL